MAENLIDLRRRIKSLTSIRKTFRAMKTVSALKLSRSVSELNKTKFSSDKIALLLRKVGSAIDVDSYPLLKQRESGKTIMVVISADKGLCGAFNSHLIGAAEKRYQGQLDENGANIALVIVGNKAFTHFSKKGYPIEKSYKSVMSRLKHQHVLDLSRYLRELYLNPEENIKKIEFVFTQYISASKRSVEVKQLFPLGSEWKQEEADTADEEGIDYIFETSAKDIFEYLLPNDIDILVKQTLLHSVASENMARMIAMEKASQNAEEMTRTLTLTMNKLRQASITGELLEIITATEALKK